MANNHGNGSSDDLPFFRPEIGRNRGGERVAVLKRTHTSSGSKTGGNASQRSHQKNSPKRGHGAVATKPSSRITQRRVVVKARIVKMGSYGKKAARLHASYLSRGNAGVDGEKGRFYNAEESDLNKEDIELVKPGEPHHFRLIVSPEDGANLDLTKYTRSLMEQVQKDLGRKLDWEAVNHYNTDNPHTHVVIHGLDADGNDVFIDREYISNGIRNRARELATRSLGERLEHEIQASINQEIGVSRFTSVDRELLEEMDSSKKINVGEYPDNPGERISRSKRIGRLQKLEELGLATQIDNYSWRVDENLKNKLQNIGHHEAAMSTMTRDMASIQNAPLKYLVFELSQSDEIEGVVLSKGLSDELYDRQYLIVGTADGSAHYVDAGRQGRGFEESRVGGVVSVQSIQEDWIKQSDKNIMQYAETHAGLFNPEDHAEHAVSSKKVSHEKLSDYAEQHRRRLVRLARFGLVEPLSGDLWRIPPDLEQKLNEKAKSAQKSLSVRQTSVLPLHDQIKYRGRTWVDGQRKVAENANEAGFGMVLRDTIQKRDQWLTSQGLDPQSPKTRNQLDQWEREDLSRKWGESANRSFRSLDKGTSFRGKLSEIIDAPSGRRYAIIDDGKEFAMVPWRSPSVSVGQEMVVGVNAEGRAWTKNLSRGISR